MNQTIRSRCRQLGYPAVLLCIAAVQILSYYMKGDDFLNIFALTEQNLSMSLMPNGRYVGNLLTYLLLGFPVLRWVLYPVLFAGLLLLLSKLVTCFFPQVSAGKWIVLLGIFLMPASMFTTVIIWLSAYGGYLFSVISTAGFLLLCIREPEHKSPRHGGLTAVGVFMLALTGGLCAEHVTIYAVFLGIAMLLLAKFHPALRVRAFHWTYLAGAVLSAVLMFTNGIYNSLAEGSDPVGSRFLEFTPCDIVMNLYRVIIPYYSHSFAPVHLLIAAALTVLYLRSDRLTKTKARSRYAKLSLGTVICYAAYTLCTTVFGKVVPLTWGMKIRAVEGAFTFLYLTALIYLSYVLLEQKSMIFNIICICSTVLLAAPFLIASPASPRCFFAEYIYWLLLAGHLACCVLSSIPHKALRTAGFAAALSAGTAVSVLLYMICCNWYVLRCRIAYLKEQIQEGKTHLAVLNTPYPQYSSNDFYIHCDGISEEDNEYYQEQFLRYYDLQMPDSYTTYKEDYMVYFLD